MRRVCVPDFDVISSLAGPCPGSGATGGRGAHRRLRRCRRDCGAGWSTRSVDAVVDATHPYAATITAHAAAVCKRTRVCRIWCWPDRPGLPVMRSSWIPTSEAAKTVTAERYSRVFLTTGRTGVGAFSDVDAWFLIRAVTAPDAGRCCPARHEVVLSRGPYRYDDELLLMRTHRVDAVVTKNSGGDMTRPKIDAAATLGIRVVMVDRPPLPPGVRHRCTPSTTRSTWVSALIRSSESRSRMVWQLRSS